MTDFDNNNNSAVQNSVLAKTQTPVQITIPEMLTGFSIFHRSVKEPKAKQALELLYTLQQHNVIQDVDYQFASFMVSELETTKFQQEQINFLALLLAKLNNQVMAQDACLDLNKLARQVNQNNKVAAWFWLPQETSNVLTEVNIAKAEQWLTILEHSELIEEVSTQNLEETKTANRPLVLFEHYLYLNRYFQYEGFICQFIKSGQDSRSEGTFWYRKLSEQQITDSVTQFFPETNTTPDLQKQAVLSSVNKGFSVITGGPGTGKTTTVVKLLASLVDLHQQQQPEHKLHIVLAAPTGKAAARLSESITSSKQKLQLNNKTNKIIPNTALTIHRLLQPRGLDQFFYNQHNPLHLDVLIIDEASMVDLSLMAKLFAAVPAKTQIVLLGDKHQLASVEVGNVLAELCRSDYLLSRGLVTELTKSWRFDDSGGIGQLATVVKAGNSSKVLSLLNETLTQQLRSDINWLKPELNQLPLLIEQGVQHFLTLYHLAETTEVDFEQQVIGLFQHLSRFQILTCVRHGENGVEGINQTLQKRLAQKGKQTHLRHYHCRPLMISENAYHLNLYNGDIGLELYDPEHKQLMAFFIQADGSVYKVLPQRLPANDTLYAMTVHKSQGSEFEHTVLVLPDNEQQSNMLSRELIYTGLTRAKSQFTLYGKTGFIENAIAKQTGRESGLAAMLTRG